MANCSDSLPIIFIHRRYLVGAYGMLERTVSFFEIRRSHIVHLLEEWTRSDNRFEIEKQPKKLTRTYLCKAQRFVKAFRKGSCKSMDKRKDERYKYHEALLVSSSWNPLTDYSKQFHNIVGEKATRVAGRKIRGLTRVRL